MTKQEKISKIYSIIARKDLSFGCYILDDNIKYQVLSVYPQSSTWIIAVETTLQITKHNYSIIGHPVMLGDVLDWLYKNRLECNALSNVEEFWYDETWNYYNNRNYIISIREKLREPVDNCTPKCIDYIYSLITK
jgi:hypothetical protein